MVKYFAARLLIRGKVLQIVDSVTTVGNSSQLNLCFIDGYLLGNTSQWNLCDFDLLIRSTCWETLHSEIIDLLTKHLKVESEIC